MTATTLVVYPLGDAPTLYLVIHLATMVLGVIAAAWMLSRRRR